MSKNKKVRSFVILVITVSAMRKGLIALGVVALLASVVASLNFSAEAQYFPEYEKYVHNFLNSTFLGNWTYIEKPMFPVLFNDSQILVGQNWSIVCPLVANHSYHVYCYGKWINNGSEPKTDYDIYVYNSLGELEGYHTESAGLPEHLGTSVDEAFFVPKYSGNYTFVIANDAGESRGADQATFMMIENVECNVWHTHYVEGKDNSSLPVFDTSWAYEFVTDSKRIEVWVKVPDSLDMYEARLYLMADPQAKNKTLLNGVPLAWEPGLFGQRKGLFGGYNLESKEYRGLAYASCEFYGQDMFLNFSSPYSGKSLYHLVFIGEAGAGSIEFLVKTEFSNAFLKPSVVPVKAYPYNDTLVAYVSNSTDLENAAMEYSIDDWKNVSVVQMEILNNRTCQAVIPGQNAGASVCYRVSAKDVLENVLFANDSYTVKNPSTLNISLIREKVYLGENITVRGRLTPEAEGNAVRVYFTSANESKEILCNTFENGTFAASYRPKAVGTFEISAEFGGDKYVYESEGQRLIVKVEEQSLLVKYSLYIGGGIGAIAIIGLVIYVKKSR